MDAIKNRVDAIVAEAEQSSKQQFGNVSDPYVIGWLSTKLYQAYQEIDSLKQDAARKLLMQESEDDA